MSLPANFASCPQEDLHHHCRNVAVEFKKIVKSSKDVNELNSALERYLNVIKYLDWHEKTSSVYHKNDNEKAANKLTKEFNRYATDLGSDQNLANPQGLLNAITEMEQLIQSLKA